MKKRIQYALLMVCIVALVSCNGIFAPQKKMDVSFILDTGVLLRSIQNTHNEPSRSAANALLSRQVGTDGDRYQYLEATLTAGEKTQTITQIFNNDAQKTELQFVNVPVGSSARIVVEVYATEGSTKYILLKGRGEIKSVRAGKNALTIKIKSSPLEPDTQNTSIIMLPDFKFTGNTPSSGVDIKYRTSTNSASQLIVTHNAIQYNDQKKSLSNFAFDVAGNVYYAYTTMDAAADYITELVKIVAETNTHEIIIPYSGGIINTVAVSKNRLYFTKTDYSVDPNAPEQAMCYLPLPISAGSLITPVRLTVPHAFKAISAVAVVQVSSGIDNIYIAGTDTADTNKIWNFQLDIETNNITSLLSISYNTFLSANDTSCIVSDMIFFDGKLMLLVTEMFNRFSTADYMSHGTLIAIDPDTMSKVTEYGASTTNHPIEEDPQNAFLNPIRFIGVMPKKLFIADDGAYAAAIYDNNIKQKNRIVTFDSETQGLSVQNVDVEFFYKVTGSAW